MQWACLCGYAWEASYASIRRGRWCLLCANTRKRQQNQLGIRMMHKLAKKQHGLCLSQRYENVNSLLEWECSEGHRFTMRASSVIAGHWCHQCGKGLSERLCRAVMEHLYSARFPRQRPKWLLSDKGTAMELDGYNEDLGLAFEYQGIQHYKPVLKFKLDSARLIEVQQRDQLKEIRCVLQNVTLLKIPYTVAHHNLEEFIRNELRQRGKALACWELLPYLDLWQLSIRVDDRLEKIRLEASRKNVVCISSAYLGNKTNLQWCCRICGNEFGLTPGRLMKSERPCPCCRATALRHANELATLGKIRALLALRRELLISTRFTGHNDPLVLRCEQGHEWSTSWASLRHGTRCTHCRAKLFKHPPRKKPEAGSRAKMSRVSKVCRTCGIEFEVKKYASTTARYCSTRCLYERNTQKTARNCVVCDVEFRSPPSHTHVLTCSPQCGYQIRDTHDQRVACKCIHCGKTFLESPSRAVRRKYCSRACVFAA